MSVTATDYKIPPGHVFFSHDGNQESDLDLLMEIKVPPPTVISQLIAVARQQYLDGAESICIPWTGQLFPLWVLDLWSELQPVVKPSVDGWAKALKWLMRTELKGYRVEVKETLRLLETVAWTGHIPLDGVVCEPADGSDAGPLAARHRKKIPTQGIQMMTTAITTEILVQYRKTPRNYDPNGGRFLQRFGATFTDQPEFAGIYHVNQNHWVAAVVDVLGKSIEFGDPGGEEDADVCAALQWFVEQHLPNSDLSSIELACTKQKDAHNCGLYTPNAIAHKFLPDAYPLFSSDVVLGDLGRLEILRRVIAKFHEQQGASVKAAPDIIAQRLHEYMNAKTSQRRSRSSSPPRTPPPQEEQLSHALGQLSVSPKKPSRKRRKLDDPDSDSDDESKRHVMAPIFKMQPKTKPKGKRGVDKKASTKPIRKILYVCSCLCQTTTDHSDR
ncbi:hypothetical protein B0H14DRAFT_3528477 [Mycena olivaceomarginata]|nr:hypothetical protein B0H14DRAFT_3528477 [Mycena olivaceomarginata]